MPLTYPCVCCGYLTLQSPPGSHDICPICGWQDDLVPLRWPDQAGGANTTSLIQAQQNYRDIGASDEQQLGHERADPADYDRAPHWRPINPRRDRFEPSGAQLAPWPEDRTVLYWWRHRDPAAWRRDAPVPLTVDDDTSQALQFAEAVRQMTSAVSPADRDNLSGMAMDFDCYLWHCPTLDTVTVTVTTSSDPARQITAACTAHRSASPALVAQDLRNVWLNYLRYQYREAHLLRQTATTVELDCITQASEDTYYITGLITVRWE
ncbi:hypothetical protein Lfu02_79470 [Longispora fulva]|uniref:Cysteine-rich CPCC domain-containing protein n=1 Tax=Longispora fulva TaxID=619741 RepID=A0A8J7G5E8_9ACTN|nr:CPCC family cysteine-rich protein [Longispora fulva]MBG6133998.1 hypothetical protein [Longispora fulva]GIG63575.1 hypothetical protein Lfu02_79470 [Longispora fulva]